MRPLLLALLIAALPAHAGKATREAEVKRLTKEAEALAGRGAWKGVDRAYQGMADLEDKGVHVPFEVHMLGARAAQELGDLRQTYLRLVRARAAHDGPADEVETWIARLESEYQLVHIVVMPSWKVPIQLENKDLGFTPDHRATIDAAEAVLEQDREFIGLLPHGRYTVGPQSFELVGGAMVQLTLKKSGDWQPPPDEDDAGASTIATFAPAASLPRSLTSSTTTVLVTLGPELTDPLALGEAAEALEDELLGLVDVKKVDLYGVTPCFHVTPTDAGDAERIQEALVPDGTRIATDPPVFAVDTEVGDPSGRGVGDTTVGDIATVARAWCAATGIRRIEVTLEAGVHLPDLREQIAEVLASADPRLDARLP